MPFRVKRVCQPDGTETFDIVSTRWDGREVPVYHSLDTEAEVNRLCEVMNRIAETAVTLNAEYLFLPLPNEPIH